MGRGGVAGWGGDGHKKEQGNAPNLHMWTRFWAGKRTIQIQTCVWEEAPQGWLADIISKDPVL